MIKKLVILVSIFAIEAQSAVAQGKIVPVLLVRGIDCSDRLLRPMEKSIRASGIEVVSIASFTPGNGQVGVDEIAKQIAEAARRLKEETKSEKIDVVAFSMGALASRYYIQKLSGKDSVRKFISISGPHSGTYAAYFRFFQKGVRDMMPGSGLIRDLEKDKDPYGAVEVFSFYTPYDLIVVPASTAIIKDSKEVRSFHVALHHQMIKDPEVLAAIVDTLVDKKSRATLAKSTM